MSVENKVVLHENGLNDEQVERQNDRGAMVMPAMMFPSFRTKVAHSMGTAKRILFRSYGGMGDEICSEPVVRFAISNFVGVEISVATNRPWIFRHLPLANLYELKVGEEDKTPYDEFLTLETYADAADLAWHFLCHNTMHCVDFASVLAFRAQMPVKARQICLRGEMPKDIPTGQIVIHPGRTWPSKTLPATWWNDVIAHVRWSRATPILIGAESTGGHTGTVDVETTGCLDLRGKLTPEETTGLLQESAVLITNDSGPLHMAASGNAWVALLSTAKHPDLVMHWRDGIFAHKMRDFSRGGMWEVYDFCPNKNYDMHFDKPPEGAMEKWLPDPKEVASWAIDRYAGLPEL